MIYEVLNKEGNLYTVTATGYLTFNNLVYHCILLFTTIIPDNYDDFTTRDIYLLEYKVCNVISKNEKTINPDVVITAEDLIKVNRLIRIKSEQIALEILTSNLGD